MKYKWVQVNGKWKKLYKTPYHTKETVDLRRKERAFNREKKLLKKQKKDSVMSKRNHKILQYRNSGKTLEVIGKQFDITKERVRQICNNYSYAYKKKRQWN